MFEFLCFILVLLAIYMIASNLTSAIEDVKTGGTTMGWASLMTLIFDLVVVSTVAATIYYHRPEIGIYILVSIIALFTAGQAVVDSIEAEVVEEVVEEEITNEY